jgi:hypothetical protein
VIIYHVPEADAGERWCPTQDQAIKCAKAYSGTVETVTAGTEGRQGMCAMLNAAEEQMIERFLSATERACQEAPAEERPAIPLKPDAGADFSASQIESFILERASVAQVERIMAALGCRFGELVKEKRK